jgi:hypothetical protein
MPSGAAGMHMIEGRDRICHGFQRFPAFEILGSGSFDCAEAIGLRNLSKLAESPALDFARWC